MPAYLKALGDTATGLLVETRAGDAESLARQVEEVRGLLSGSPDRLPVAFTDRKAEYEKLWNVRKGLFPAVGAARQIGTTVVIEDVVFPIETLADATVELEGLMRKHGYDEGIIFGHALEGNLHFVFTQDFGDPEEVARYQRFMEDVCDMIGEEVRRVAQGRARHGPEHGPLRGDGVGGEGLRADEADQAGLRPEGPAEPRRDHQRQPPRAPGGPEAPAGGARDHRQVHRVRLLRGHVPVQGPHDDAAAADRHPAGDLPAAGRRRRRGARSRGSRSRLPLPGRADVRDGRVVRHDLPRVDRHGGTHEGASLRCREGTLRPRSAARWTAGHYAHGHRRGPGRALPRWGAARTVLGRPRPGRRGAGGARALSGGRLPLWNPCMPRAAPARSVRGRRLGGSARKVVYFPSCVVRSMGPATGDPDQRALYEAILSLLEKAGYDVLYPPGMRELCCGMPFGSKGFFEEAEQKRAELEAALLACSRNGEYPVLFDTSPCLYTVKRKQDPRLRLYEPVEFIHAFLLDALEFTKIPETSRSTSRAARSRWGFGRSSSRWRGRARRRWWSPITVGCCGVAGDRIFHFPELNESALSELATACPPDAGPVIRTAAPARSGSPCKAACRTSRSSTWSTDARRGRRSGEW